MGCDIHPFIEYQVFNDGHWWSFSNGEIMLGRNYVLFGYMAGVRGDGPAVAEPRGIPNDASWIVKDQWKERGEHTPSWLTLWECKKVTDLIEADPCLCPPLEWPPIVSLMQILADATSAPVRLVFWFDS